MIIHSADNGFPVCYDSGFKKGRFGSWRLVKPVWKGQSALGSFCWLWFHIHLGTEFAWKMNRLVKACLVLVVMGEQARRKPLVRAEAWKTLLFSTCIFSLMLYEEMRLSPDVCRILRIGTTGFCENRWAPRPDRAFLLRLRTGKPNNDLP